MYDGYPGGTISDPVVGQAREVRIESEIVPPEYPSYTPPLQAICCKTNIFQISTSYSSGFATLIPSDFAPRSNANTTKHGVIIFENSLHQNSSGFAVYAFERGAKSDGMRVAKPEEYEVEV